jgi:uncharacterized protein (TIGR03435 family)
MKLIRRVCAILTFAGMGIAQSAPDAAPKFEVASIKLVKEGQTPASEGPGRLQKGAKKGTVRAVSPGRVHVCADLNEILRNAYIQYPEDPAHFPRAIEGGPAWMDSDRYDINAKAEDAADQATLMGPMLRALLAERFQLKVHRETREIPVYDLTVAKGGPKLAQGNCTVVDWTKHPPLPAPGEKPFCGTSEIQGKPTYAQWDLRGAEISQFTGALGGLVLDRPVIDKTGLTGMFDFHLEFGYDTPGLKMRHPPVPEGDPGGAPSLFAAVQKLGLKLEPAKGSSDYLVVDSVARPAEN